MTHLHDVVNKDDLARALAERLVNIRESHDGQRILNYSDAAMYTPGAWDNPAVRACRGLIVDPDNRVVARPWAKFFNHGQPEAGYLDMDAPVEVTDKMDGSLGIVHLDEAGDVRVATRGSFESDQAIHATAWIRAQDWRPKDIAYYTPLVEIIYPGNRIVCDYGDRDELVLLGAVDAYGMYYGPELAGLLCDWRGPVTKTFDYPTLRDALAAAPRPGAEGLCVRFVEENRIVKIKQADYVALHRIVTGLSERSVWEHMVSGAALEQMLADLPDELHPWTRGVWDRITSDLGLIHLRAILTHQVIVDHLNAARPWERGEYARIAQKHAELRPYLFNLLDGKDPRPSILRTLKPAGDTRAKTISEAVA